MAATAATPVAEEAAVVERIDFVDPEVVVGMLDLRRHQDRAALLEEECVVEPMILHDDTGGQGAAIKAHRFLHRRE